MMFPRPGGLRTLIVCLAGCLPLLGQQPAPQQQPPQQPPPQQKKANPFEAVPQAPEAPKPTAPAAGQPETPARPPTDNVEAIEFRNARRVPADTLRAMIATKVGEHYDPQVVDRDLITLWNTTRFNDLHI